MSKTVAIKSNAKKAAQKTANFASNNTKEILVAAAILVGGYLLYTTLKGISDAAKAASDDPNAGGGNTTVNDPGQKPPQATITNLQAQVAAADLLAAMDSIGGVNKKEFAIIKRVFKDKNAIDIALITEKFGEPKRSPVTGEESFWFFGERLNLLQWLSIELDEQQKSELRRQTPGVI